MRYSKTCFKRILKKTSKIGFQDQVSLNAGQKFCRMLQWEHSAILLTFIKLPSAIKIFVLSIFEWPLKTGFTVRSFPLKRLALLFHAYWSISKLIATRFHKQTPSYPVFLFSLKRCEQVFHSDTFQTLYQSFQTLFHTIKGYHWCDFNRTPYKMLVKYV